MSHTSKEDAFSHTSSTKLTSLKDEEILASRLLKRTHLSSPSPISTFGFMTIHSLTRASSGALHHSGILVGTLDSSLTLYDVYSNVLLSTSLPSPALHFSASQNQEDMYVGILTQDNQVCILNVTVHKNYRVNSTTRQLEPVENTEQGTQRIRFEGKVKGFEYA